MYPFHLTTHARLICVLFTLIIIPLWFGGCPDSSGNPSGLDPNSLIVDGGISSGGTNASGNSNSGSNTNQNNNSNGNVNADVNASDAPVVYDRAALTQPDTPIEIKLRGSATSHQSLRFSIVAPPMIGSLSDIDPIDNISASIRYSPPPEYRGKIQFSYKAYDGVNDSNVGTVIIYVYAPVVFELDTYAGNAPLTVSGRAFTMTGDPLPAGEYCWNWGGYEVSGPVDVFGESTHTFTSPGKYTVKLTLLLAGLTQPIACTHLHEDKVSRFATINVSTASPLTVSPSDDLESQGDVGGAFYPRYQDYTLTNEGMASLNWAAAKEANWLSLSEPASGTLAPGASTTLRVSINETVANSLPAGDYSDTITFRDETNDLEAATRRARLIVTDRGTIQIAGRIADGGGTGISGVTISGLPGNPVTNANGNYSAMVSYGWSGTAAPSKAGYSFSPTSRSYDDVRVDQINHNYIGSALTYTISGRIADGDGTGISGATISGLPGSPVTNASGDYSATVSYGWSGTAAPSKAGYSFNPAARSYSNVTTHYANQNYTGSSVAYTISGRITTSSGTGISGVTISGLPGNPVTNANGEYSSTVSYGWSGTAMPSKAGYSFSPAARSYSNVATHYANQNYIGSLLSYTISGRITTSSGTGISGVTVSGLPSNPVTNASGDYSATVSYGWSGTATPNKAGYTFVPAARSYNSVTANQANQNYTGSTVNVTISGFVRDGSSNPVSGVLLSASNGGGSTTTAADGSYTLPVAYAWSGRITPSKTGYTFSPAYRDYANVTANLVNQNYTGSALTYTISGRVTDGGGTGISGVTISGLPGNPVTNASGDYSATVNYGWSGTATPSKAGYSFNPAARSYNNVTGNQANQNYAGSTVSVTISGLVRDGSSNPISGVLLTANNGGGSTTTAADGSYTLPIPYNWSGRVTPSKTGYTFSPGYRDYVNVTSSQSGWNYAGSALTFVISGHVADGSDAVISGVTISGLPGNPVTNASGDYSATVSYGWSGTATPSKTGYTFNPVSRTYSNITASQANQNYTGTQSDEQWADSISQYGITWTFDREYRVGQFVNGDWWVVGPVTVVAIDPPPQQYDFGGSYGVLWINGSMINPVCVDKQAYDGRISYFDALLLLGNTEFVLSVNESLVSTISQTAFPVTDMQGVVFSNDRSRLSTAAVLTSLSATPPSNAFRPPYFGTNKFLRNISDVRWELLPNLEAPAHLPPFSYAPNAGLCSGINEALSTWSRYFQRVWLDHLKDWPTQGMHPYQNMPIYGREIVATMGDAAALLCLDAPLESKRDIAIGMIQAGIDYYGISSVFKHVYLQNGGHGPGRKFPIHFAGLMLNDMAMLTMSDYDAQENSPYFGDCPEYGHILWTGWQYSGHPYATNVLYDFNPNSTMWSMEQRCHQRVSPTMWFEEPWPVNGNFPHDQFEGYERLTAYAWMSQAIAARILGLIVYWNHEAYFAYCDRWAYEDDAPIRAAIQAAYETNKNRWLIHTGSVLGSHYPSIDNDIILDISASGIDGAYVGNNIKTKNANGSVNSVRTIIAYVGFTRTATVSQAWQTSSTPNDTMSYEIHTPPGPIGSPAISPQGQSYYSQFAKEMYETYRPLY